MLRHSNDSLRISALAALSGLSTSHFYTVFKSATGFTPIAYFISLRIQRACELLHDPRLSVKEAADLAGYEDPFYFTRVFKRVIGVPPSEYQRAWLRSSEKTPEGAPGKRGKESQRLPSLAFALSMMKNLGIAAEGEPAEMSARVRSSSKDLDGRTRLFREPSRPPFDMKSQMNRTLKPEKKTLQPVAS